MNITEGFRINFLKIAAHPTLKEIEEFDMNHILTSLLSFINLQSITAADAIETLLSGRETSVLRFLHHNKSYKFPPNYDGCFGSDRFRESRFEEVKREFIEPLLLQITLIEERMSQEQQRDQKVQHDLVKEFCTTLFSAACEKVVLNGGTVVELNVVRLPPTGIHDLRTGNEVTSILRVVSKPDMVIGSDKTLPGIPVEVYSPIKYDHTMEMAQDEPEDETENLMSSSSECENFKDVKLFLNKNLPTKFVRKMSSGCLGRFRKKLSQQLLVQLLGVAKKYVRYSDAKKLASRHTAIGFFAFDFKIYIVKLVGKCEDISLACECDTFWLDNQKGKYPLDVTFYPSPLDMQNPSHAIALLFFIRKNLIREIQVNVKPNGQFTTSRLKCFFVLERLTISEHWFN